MTFTTKYSVGQKLAYKIEGGRAVCMVQAVRVRSSKHGTTIIYEVLTKWRGANDRGIDTVFEKVEYPDEQTLASYNPKAGDAS